MSIATFLRGLVTTAEAGVDTFFAEAQAAVKAAPFLPANIKTDLGQTLTDAENDIHALEGLAGTLGGTVAADAVDDLTTLLAETAQNVSTSGADLSKLSAGEKATLQQTWAAMKAQGDALVAQVVAGVNILQQPAKAP
jgi:hypothetical protein